MQIRQAVRFGVRSTAIGLAALLWPLIASLFVGNLTLTIVVYTMAIAIDCVLLVVWLRHSVRYSKRAARGETFDLDPIAGAPARKLAAKQ